jgi:hypothetical protein
MRNMCMVFVIANHCSPLRLGIPSTQNSVGRPKHPRVMAGAVEGDLFIGKKAQELRGLLKVCHKHSRQCELSLLLSGEHPPADAYNPKSPD